MNKSKQCWFAMCLGVSSLFAACADDSNVDQTTAQAAASELVSSVDSTLTGYQGSSGGSGAIAVKCSSGGEASVSGKVDVSTKPVAVDIKVSIDYQGCKSSNGTTMEGTVDVVQSVIAGKDPVHVKTQYSGNVVFSGKVEANCPVDITVEVDETGKAVNVQGTFCGQDAKSLDIHVSPRWKQ
jgi:hypothetical protein